MKHPILPALSLLGWAALVFAPSVAPAQNYNPENGGQIVQGITINASGQGQINGQNEAVGTIGVEECRDLVDNEDARATFTFQLNENYRRVRGPIQYDSALFMEFAAGDFTDKCDRNTKTSCKVLDNDKSGITLNPVPTEDVVPQAELVVQVDFDTLLEYEDDRTETCAFAAPTNPMSGPRIPLQSDGGLSDADLGVDSGAGDTGSSDTGTADTSTNGGSSDTGTADTSTNGGADTGPGATSEGDRFYVARVFLTGLSTDRFGNVNEQKKVADAALKLDLTRPAKPTNVRGDATENKVVVKFEPPAQTGDIESYHVFHSNSPFQMADSPERLEEQDGVKRRILTGTSEKDGTIKGEATGIDRTAGEDLYIGIASRDSANNFSGLAQRGSPVQIKRSVNFPYDGTETGGCGCSAAPALPTGVLVALLGLGVYGLRRTNRDDSSH